MRRTLAIVTAAVAVTAGAALVSASPAAAVPPPPVILCANDFSTNNLTGWSTDGGTWSVARGSYRQASTRADNARSWFQAEYYSHSATAKVKLTSATRPSSFVAFAIAVRGANTSYRLALTANSTAQLQYVKDGVVTVLASQALPVTAGTWYTINMGTVSQTQLFAMVDGVWLFGGGYVSIPAGGHYLGGVGFSTSRASGVFDDLSVTHYGPSSEPRCPTTP